MAADDVFEAIEHDSVFEAIEHDSCWAYRTK